MASKRDQLQAHQFLVQRVVSALVTRETDPEQPPFRRPSGAAFGSVALAVVAVLAVWVYGLVVPGGNDSWRSGDAVIVEKETGTRYVYVDDRLHPVANFTSALLILGQHGEPRTVSRASLEGAPRGPRVGIVGAPDSLPAMDRLRQGAWTMCSSPGVDEAGAALIRTVLRVGDAIGGSTLADRALLVKVAETGERYLVWNGYRHVIDDYPAVAAGLALQSEPWMTVGMSLIDVLPAGAPISPIRPADVGAASSAVPSAADVRVGQLFVVRTSGGEVQHLLAEKERLRPISALQYDIQLAADVTADAYGDAQPAGLPLGPAAASAAAQSPPESPAPANPPATRPDFAGGDGGSVCAGFEPGAAVPRLALSPAPAGTDQLIVTAGSTENGTPLTDAVIVAPGSATVVEAMPSTDAPAGTISVVTDLGYRHPLADPALLGVLGYEGVRPVRMPAGLVARIPEGPGLDASAAMRP
ncbi:type VII secretion protein EccB [Amycolatopsis marina]|uniref:Type VII secretion protein EccB n=1 Tax=Amycolatopsis marina TaxID=490629 RepID=A0A1I1AEG2_9PSEU|nr:type VII secretion protein EccB [Amycolatopsis marina]SFB35756.1 type VII secretion protein EccB [Amycolatopsis marina]